MRTLFVCALAASLTACSSQQPTPPCASLNPLACLTAVNVQVEPEPQAGDSAAVGPVPATWRGDNPPPPRAHHPVHRTPRPAKVVAKAAPAIPTSPPLPNLPTTGVALVAKAADIGAADSPSPPEIARTRTMQEQVAVAAAVAEQMSVPTLDASLDALVAVLVTSPDVTLVSDLAGKSVAIDDRYSEPSINRVRIAMAAAGARDARLGRGQTPALDRLAAKEVPAAIVGLFSADAANSFPEIARFRTFQVPLSRRPDPAKP